MIKAKRTGETEWRKPRAEAARPRPRDVRDLTPRERREPTRYEDRETLQAATREWCLAQLAAAGADVQGTRGVGYVDEDGRRVGFVEEQLAGVQALAEDTAGRTLANRYRALLGEAESIVNDARGLLAREDAGARRPTAYSRELRKAIEVLAPLRRVPRVRGQDSEIVARRLLVVVVDTPRKSTLTNRQLACRSIVAGNGRDWAMTACARARSTGNKLDRPTVLAAVKAEERAIALMRTRVAKDLAQRQEKARALDESRAVVRR